MKGQLSFAPMMNYTDISPYLNHFTTLPSVWCRGPSLYPHSNVHVNVRAWCDDLTLCYRFYFLTIFYDLDFAQLGSKGGDVYLSVSGIDYSGHSTVCVRTLQKGDNRNFVRYSINLDGTPSRRARSPFRMISEKSHISRSTTYRTS